MSLPTDRDARNAIPLWGGLFSYFPDVWAEVAKVSVLGNKQHNLGAKLFWNREVSTDHLNKVMRHCFDHGTGSVMDTDGTFHMAKVVWRACAELQLAIEARGAGETNLSDEWEAALIPKTYKPIVEYSGWAHGPSSIQPGDVLTVESDGEKLLRAEAQDVAAKKRAESY